MKPVIRILLYTLLILLFGGCNTSSTAGSPSSSPLYISGWLAMYDSGRGLSSFAGHIQCFDEINPVWYNLNLDYFQDGGTPLFDDSGDKSILLKLARDHGVKVLPTIQNFGVSNFDPVVISKIINHPEFRTKHVAEIVDLVMSQSYDGVDIDYENLSARDQAAYTAFIAELRTALAQHQKLLSVTVYARTSGTGTWNGPGAQDWSALAQYADTLKVMVYDYHWVSSHAGPVSPVDWLRDVLSFARTIRGVAGKLVIGLPFYGFDWPAGSSGREVMYEDAVNIVNRETSPVSRANSFHSAYSYCRTYFANVEPHFQYNQNGIRHTVYFQDAAALGARLRIINAYRDIVKGITFWHLGGEDPRSWDIIKNSEF